MYLLDYCDNVLMGRLYSLSWWLKNLQSGTVLLHCLRIMLMSIRYIPYSCSKVLHLSGIMLQLYGSGEHLEYQSRYLQHIPRNKLKSWLNYLHTTYYHTPKVLNLLSVGGDGSWRNTWKYYENQLPPVRMIYRGKNQVSSPRQYHPVFSLR